MEKNNFIIMSSSKTKISVSNGNLKMNQETKQWVMPDNEKHEQIKGKNRALLEKWANMGSIKRKKRKNKKITRPKIKPKCKCGAPLINVYFGNNRDRKELREYDVSTHRGEPRFRWICVHSRKSRANCNFD